MKAIFLDIDGVLNCESTHETTRSGVTFVEDRFVKRLKTIVDATDARVVLSSDWRYDRDCVGYNGDYLELVEKLFEYGIEFYGFTSVCLRNDRGFPIENRGFEINQYLIEHHEVDKFVILDDRCDMEPHLDRLVMTSYDTGLTEEDVKEAIELLSD